MAMSQTEFERILAAVESGTPLLTVCGGNNAPARAKAEQYRRYLAKYARTTTAHPGEVTPEPVQDTTGDDFNAPQFKALFLRQMARGVARNDPVWIKHGYSYLADNAGLCPELQPKAQTSGLELKDAYITAWRDLIEKAGGPEKKELPPKNQIRKVE